MLKITFYNTSVEVRTSDQRLIDHIDRFLSRYYTSTQKAQGNSTEDNSTLYAGKVLDQPIYLLHVNQFFHLHDYLIGNGIDISRECTERVNARTYDIVPTSFKVRDGWIPKDYQEPIVEFLVNNPGKSKLVPIQTGKGKATSLYTQIKVPGGWKLMKDIQVGDTITNSNGSTSKVTGVYPQGVESLYRVEFVDGRYERFSKDHLWSVYITENDLTEAPLVVTTLQLQNMLLHKTNEIFIKTPVPEDGPDVPLEISPFKLGYLFVNCEGDDLFNNNIPTEFNRNIALVEQCLNGSKKQRQELLKGFLSYSCMYDPDFHTLSMKTINMNYAKYVQTVVRSLGGQCTITRNETTNNRYYRSPDWLHEYTVTLSIDDMVDYVTSDITEYYIPRHQIGRLKLTQIEYLGEDETQCISVDSIDSLFVVSDYITTHNTFTALYSIGQIKKRLGIVVLSQYTEKWVSDVLAIHEATTQDVILIEGSAAIRAIVQMAKDDKLPQNYIIFSNRTLQIFIKEYEKNPELCNDTYGCTPIELFSLLGIGIMLVDEFHQHFHSVFKILIYSNVWYQIGLSATLLSTDPVVQRMYKIVYPEGTVYEGGELDRYADVYPVGFNIDQNSFKYIKTKHYGSNNYSHTAFENSISKRSDLLGSYAKLIKSVAEIFYTEPYKEKDKLLIFVATVDLATTLTSVFEKLYPDKKVKRYCEKDPYEHVIEGEIIVSTPISAGTALDIPNLRVVIQTVNISSPTSNVQNLGRLRKLNDRDVKFVYLYCNQISKHRQYHRERMELFANRVANISPRQSSVTVGVR